MKIRTIIKAIIIYSLIAIINPLFAFAQPSLKGTWCNGFDFVFFQKKTGKRILLQGGTLHEGGSNLTLEWINENRFKHIEKEYKNGWGVYNNSDPKVKEILIEEINSNIYMLAFDANNKVVDVMKKLNDKESLFFSIINELSIVGLDGKYKDKKGNTVSIDGRKMTFEGLGNKEQKFTIPEGSYDFPMSDVIRLANGKTYKYVCQYGKLLIVPIDLKTIKGEEGYRVDFDAYEAAGNTDEDPSKVIGDTIVLSKLDDDNIGGYFPVVDEQLIMPSILHNLTSGNANTIQLLEAIVDEIYARNGYSFPGEPRKKAMFSGREWYKPTINDLDMIDPSYMELINLHSLMKAINYAKENMKYD